MSLWNAKTFETVHEGWEPNLFNDWAKMFFLLLFKSFVVLYPDIDLWTESQGATFLSPKDSKNHFGWEWPKDSYIHRSCFGFNTPVRNTTIFFLKIWWIKEWKRFLTLTIFSENSSGKKILKTNYLLKLLHANELFGLQWNSLETTFNQWKCPSSWLYFASFVPMPGRRFVSMIQTHTVHQIFERSEAPLITQNVYWL